MQPFKLSAAALFSHPHVASLALLGERDWRQGTEDN
jgi:hypothetical protein